MGWLRDTWRYEGYKSAEEVAAYMLDPRRWPAGKAIAKRSLGNNLRALDQGRRLGWWNGRPELLYVLATALHRDPDELHVELFEKPRQREVERPAPTFRFDAASGIQSLDLVREPLPPGIPQAAFRAGLWNRAWWQTRDRRAVHLVGRWLAARARARYVVGLTWDAIREQLPPDGRVLIDLTASGDPEDWLSATQKYELDGLQVCVAAPYPPAGGELLPLPGRVFKWRAASRDEERLWDMIAPARTHEWLRALVAWARERMPTKRRPDADELLASMKFSTVARFFAGPGDALDFIELYVALGTRKRPSATDLERWASRWCERSLAASSEDDASLERGSDVVQGLLERLLCEGPSPWGVGWGRSRWRSALPKEVIPPADIKAALTLADGVADYKPEEFRRKLKRTLSPQPTAVIQALRTAGLLTDAARDRHYRLAPSWALEALYTTAFEWTVDNADPKLIGSLARQPHLASPLVWRLYENLVVGDTRCVERVLSLDPDRNNDPVSLAALEVCVLALGLARLRRDDLPQPLLERAWRLRKILILTPTTDDAFMVLPLCEPASDETSIVGADVFCAAMLSLCEACEPRLLEGPAVNALLSSASASATILARTRSDHALLTWLFRFSGRIVRRRHALESASLPAEAEWLVPAYLFAFSRECSDPPTSEDLDALVALRVGQRGMPPALLLAGLEAIESLFERDAQQVLACLWRAWSVRDIAASPPVMWLHEAPLAADSIWERAPHELVRPFLSEVLKNDSLPSASMPAGPCWHVWFELCLTTREDFARDTKHRATWESIPEHAIELFFTLWSPSHEAHSLAIEIAWRRIPARLVALVERGPFSRFAGLLPQAPDNVSDQLLPVVAGRMHEIKRGSIASRSVVIFLQGLIARRNKGVKQLLTLQNALQES